MNTKHTPGPWTRDDDGFIYAGSGETYVTLADFDCTRDLDIDEREANKSLACAAPELLAALELAVHYLDHPDIRAMNFAMRSEVASVKAHVAIAKAKA